MFKRDPGPETSSPALVPRPLDAAAAWAWRIIVVAAAVVLVAYIAFQLRVVTVPIFLATLLSTVLLPPANFLRRHGFKPALATATVFLGSAVLVSGLIYGLAAPVSGEFKDLGPQVSKAVDDVKNWLATGPLQLDQQQLDTYAQQIKDSVQSNSGALRTGVVHSATLAVEIFTGILLSIVLTFYFVKDGDRLIAGIIEMFPGHRRAVAERAASRAFHTLASYLRGVAATGLVDALSIGVALYFIGVPLLLPLVVLTFFGAFFPVVGASAAGALAAAVALVNGGPTDALLVILAVLAVQQIEGHILQPLLVGRAVSLHPVVILVSLGSGAVVAGLLGAFLAVPIAAMTGAVVRELRGGEPPTVLEEPSAALQP